MTGAFPPAGGSEGRMLAEMADAVAESVVAPVAGAIDREGEVPVAVVDALAEQGLLAAGVPEISGEDVDPVYGPLVVSRLARVSASVGALVAAIHESAAAYGDRSRLVDRDPRQAPAAILTGISALRGVNGELLDGTSPRVERACVATRLVVVGDDDGEATVVETDTASDGVEIGVREVTSGLRGVDVAGVTVKGCRVGDGERVGGTGDARRARTTRALMNAAIGLGICEGAHEAAERYAAERRQFGAPIGTFAAVRGHLLDMDQRIATVAALLWRAASADPVTDIALAAANRAARAAVEASRAVPRLAVQVFGGYGYMEEYPVEVRMRDGASLGARAGGTESLLATLATAGQRS